MMYHDLKCLSYVCDLLKIFHNQTKKSYESILLLISLDGEDIECFKKKENLEILKLLYIYIYIAQYIPLFIGA